MKPGRLLLICSFATIGYPIMVFGQTASDANTGLAVSPPPGYSAKVAPARGRYTALIDVKRSDERDTGCKVGFQPVSNKEKPSQDEINRLADTADRKVTIQNALGGFYNIERVDRIDHQGIRGSIAMGRFKELPGIPADAARMVNVFYLLETPAGRTTIICLAQDKVIDARKREFDLVVRGVTVPR
jgi:hypothetical protein